MHCVVTGAAGFVGSSLCDRLLVEGHSVLGIDSFVDYYPRHRKESNLREARSSERFQLVESDLGRCDVAEVIGEAEIIFHQAAQAGVRASWGTQFEDYCHHNVLATQRLLEAVKGNTRVKCVVYASSSSVYGDAESFPTSELIRPQPVSPYGVTKLAGEHLMVLYAREFGVPTISLRYFTVFGPRQRPDMAFHKFIRAALRGEELTLYGDGTQSRDFTYISDIVQANVQAASRRGSGEVCNIGGGLQATVNEVLSMLESLIGKLKVKRLERQVGDARHTSADIGRARALIGYEPRVGLKEGLTQEIAWIEQMLRES